MNLLRGISPYWPVKLALSLGLIGYGVFASVAGALSPSLVEVPLWSAQLLLITGAAIHISHYVILKRGAEHLGAPSRLVCSGGLFRWVRHPMYLGDAILMAGAALLAIDLLALAAYAVFVVNLVLLSLDEDRMMAGLFGQEFRKWRRDSHLLIPGIL